jgi:hypothetical protein
MRVNRIVFDKMRMEWDIAKFKTGVRDYFEESGLSVEMEGEELPMLDETMNEMFNEMLDGASPELRQFLGLEEDQKENKPKLKEGANMKDQIEFKIHEATEALTEALRLEDYLLADKLDRQIIQLKSDLEALKASGEEM